jgi:hypothetical protein
MARIRGTDGQWTYADPNTALRAVLAQRAARKVAKPTTVTEPAHSDANALLRQITSTSAAQKSNTVAEALTRALNTTRENQK